VELPLPGAVREAGAEVAVTPGGTLHIDPLNRGVKAAVDGA